LTYEDRYPEARGPGIEGGDGSVIYGAVDVIPRTFVTPRRDPAEVRAEQAAEAEWERTHPRCDRCREVPDDVIEAVTAAMQAASKKAGAR
jgi:hypothetical protein